jgi:hypothetical protein
MRLNRFLENNNQFSFAYFNLLKTDIISTLFKLALFMLSINIYIYQVLWTKYRSHMSSYRRHIVDISELKPEKNYLFVEKKFFLGIKKREKNPGIPIINR